MKTRFFLLTTFLTMFVLTSINCTMQANDNNPKPKSKKSVTIYPDVFVKKIYGDTISEVIFSPKEVKLYRLIPNVKPSDNDVTIGGYKVENDMGKISRDYYPILQFLLADSCNYSDDVLIPAMPFSPTYAVEFKTKNEKVCLAFSFDSREIAIIHNGVKIKYQQINIPRKLMLFVKGLDDNNFLRDQLKNAKQ